MPFGHVLGRLTVSSLGVRAPMLWNQGFLYLPEFLCIQVISALSPSTSELQKDKMLVMMDKAREIYDTRH